MNIYDKIEYYIKEKNNDCYYIDDSDFLKYFNFYCTDNYIHDFFDFIEDEFCFTTNFSNFYNGATNNPIIIDFENNILETVSESKNIYNFLKNNKSIYHPTFIATNSLYAKPLIIMFYNNYKNIQGYNYILYRFIDIISYIIYLYCSKKDCIDIASSISIPFSIDFILNYNFNIPIYSQSNKVYLNV